MNFTNTNRRTVTLAITALAGVTLAATLPQIAHAQMGMGMGMGKQHMGAGAPGGGMDPAQREKMMAAQKKMVADLHITPDQQTKMKKVQTDMRSKMMAVYADKTLTDDKKKAKMMDMSTKARAQMDAIFTPEQRTKLKAMREQMMQQRMKQMQASGMTGGMASKPAHQ